MRLRPSGFPVHTPLGYWCCPHRRGRLAKRPLEKCQVAVCHVFESQQRDQCCEPSKEAMMAGEVGRELEGDWGRNGSTAKIYLPCKYQSMVLLSSTGQLLNHSWRGGEEMRGVPSPTRPTDACCQELLTLLVDLHSQVPHSKHLPAPLQTVSVALASSCRWGPQESDCPSLPFPLTGVCSKDCRDGCSEKLKEKFPLASAPSQGNPKCFPVPHTRPSPHSWGPSPQGRLARIQP